MSETPARSSHAYAQTRGAGATDLPAFVRPAAGCVACDGEDFDTDPARPVLISTGPQLSFLIP